MLPFNGSESFLDNVAERGDIIASTSLITRGTLPFVVRAKEETMMYSISFANLTYLREQFSDLDQRINDKL